MIDPYIDITKVSYSSKKEFNLLFVKENNIDIDDFNKYEINALSFVEQGLNIQESWLREISSKIEGLRLNNYSYSSLIGVAQFRNLQYFQLIGDVSDGEIPFVELENLKEVDLKYQDKTCNQIFERKDIEYLDLGYYKERSGSKLEGFKKIKQLSLKHCVFSDLSFISDMNDLKKISVSYNSKLTHIEALGKVNNTLKSIGIQNCKKISDWHVLKEMKELEFIYIENCGEIESLDFLSNLPKLRALYIIGSTKILDGKLKKIINKNNIEKVNVVIQKNYDITRDDVRKFDFVQFIEIE
ncbi:hypothetical protein Q4R69_04125 [Morganella morganii subsp. sibonii]